MKKTSIDYVKSTSFSNTKTHYDTFADALLNFGESCQSRV